MAGRPSKRRTVEDYEAAMDGLRTYDQLRSLVLPKASLQDRIDLAHALGGYSMIPRAVLLKKIELYEEEFDQWLRNSQFDGLQRHDDMQILLFLSELRGLKRDIQNNRTDDFTWNYNVLTKKGRDSIGGEKIGGHGADFFEALVSTKDAKEMFGEFGFPR